MLPAVPRASPPEQGSWCEKNLPVPQKVDGGYLVRGDLAAGFDAEDPQNLQGKSCPLVRPLLDVAMEPMSHHTSVTATPVGTERSNMFWSSNRPGT